MTAIRVRSQVVAAVALLFACASNTARLPVCPELESMQPLPNEQCLADPETRERVALLERLEAARFSAADPEVLLTLAREAELRLGGR